MDGGRGRALQGRCFRRRGLAEAPLTRRLRHDGWSTAAGHRWVMRAILALFYLVAGIVHLKSPDAFLPIMPDWVPNPRLVVIVTGFCEVAGAIGLVRAAA